MAGMRVAGLALALCCLFAQSTANRQLQQTPAFQGLPLTITNTADPAATQTQTATGATADVPVPSPSESAPVLPAEVTAQTPAGAAPQAQVPAAQAPVTPVLTVTAPAPAPSTPVLPTVTAPTPAPAATPPTAAVPAPSNATTPLAPAPAPLVLPVIRAPVPAPMVAAEAPVPVPAPVPAPAPDSLPLCGVQPQCRVFVEDMLCCDTAGAINDKQHMVMRLQCTHPVNYYPKCVNLSGPANLTAFSQFETATWAASHAVQVNFLEEFTGNATLDIEGPRTSANLSADCGLYISPCRFNGSIVTQVAPVPSFSFTTLENAEFLEVAASVSDDLNNLDSLVMTNPFYPSACQQQNLGDLSAEFYSNEWATYASGFQNTCNYTAFAEALAPAPAASPISEGSVATASLG